MNPFFIACSVLMGALAGIEGLSYHWTHPEREGGVMRVVLANGRPASAGEERQPLPEVYRKAAPMLRCTHGEVWWIRYSDGISLNLSFFEWLGTDAGSVLEAFRHVPEICLGSVGLKRVSEQPPVSYSVGSQTLVFEHLIFREAGDMDGFPTSLIHSFRGVWVAGSGESVNKLALDSRQRLRGIRLECAAKRERPPYACVLQGAVRGALTHEAAWSAFEKSMLAGLTFSPASDL